jgi:hypothetical protein
VVAGSSIRFGGLSPVSRALDEHIRPLEMARCDVLPRWRTGSRQLASNPLPMASKDAVLVIRLASDPASVSDLAAVASAVEALLAGAAWPDICLGTDAAAAEVRDRLRTQIAPRSLPPYPLPSEGLTELARDALFIGAPSPGGRRQPARRSWATREDLQGPLECAALVSYAAWLRSELRPDNQAFERYVGYAAVVDIRRRSPARIQIALSSGTAASAGAAGVVHAPAAVQVFTLALAIIQAAIMLRQQQLELRERSARVRTAVALEAVRTAIYTAAGEKITEEVAELAARTATPGVLGLSEPEIVEAIELRPPPTSFARTTG